MKGLSTPPTDSSIATLDIPPCPFGGNCYRRKNLEHFANFWHPITSHGKKLALTALPTPAGTESSTSKEEVDEDNDAGEKKKED